MRVLRDKRVVVLAMRDSHCFEIDCPNESTARQLVAALEIGIADTIEQVMKEQDNGSIFCHPGISH